MYLIFIPIVVSAVLFFILQRLYESTLFKIPSDKSKQNFWIIESTVERNNNIKTYWTLNYTISYKKRSKVVKHTTITEDSLGYTLNEVVKFDSKEDAENKAKELSLKACLLKTKKELLLDI